MKKRNKTILSLLGLTLLVFLGYYFRPVGSLENHMARLNVPVVGMGLIKDGKISEISIIGALEKGKLAPENTIFNVASLTKPIFAITVLKLVENGDWDLDEPIYPYWIDPDIKDDKRHQKLTTRIILSHQTGFSNWRWNNGKEKLAFNFDPGTDHGYSGEGYEYLRYAIETKFQKSIIEISDSLIFQPLGMNDTRYIWDEGMEAAPFAKWHNKRGELYDTFKRSDPCAADDLMTSVEDYCKFAIHVLNGAGLSSTLFDDMVKSQIKVSRNVGSGLGWEIYQNLPDEEYALVHGGSDRGVRARVILLPKSKDGIVIMTNGDKGMKIIRRLIKENMKYGSRLI